MDTEKNLRNIPTPIIHAESGIAKKVIIEFSEQLDYWREPVVRAFTKTLFELYRGGQEYATSNSFKKFPLNETGQTAFILDKELLIGRIAQFGYVGTSAANMEGAVEYATMYTIRITPENIRVEFNSNHALNQLPGTLEPTMDHFIAKLQELI